MVIGPTPPGTGVIDDATSIAPGSTSPTRPASVRFIPTSTTTARSLTMSGETSAGDADRGDDHVGVERVALQVLRVRMAERHRRVRLLEQVHDGLADDRAAADHDRARAVELDVVLGEERHHAERRRRDDRRPAEVELARVQRMEAVDVLRRRDRADDLRLVDVLRAAAAGRGSRRCPSRRSARRAWRAARPRWSSAGQAQVGRVEAGLGRRLVLEPDVDLGGRVVADEDGDEPDVADRLDLFGDLARGCAPRAACPSSVSLSCRCESRLFRVRWPRKNDASSIEQRRRRWASTAASSPRSTSSRSSSAAESLVGVAVIPVSAVPGRDRARRVRALRRRRRRRDRPRRPRPCTSRSRTPRAA